MYNCWPLFGLLGSFALTLGVNFRCEGLFKAQCNKVHDKHKDGHENASGLTKPQSSTQEREGWAIVHGVVSHVEGKACHNVVHEDAKVVTQVGASDAERPHGAKHKHVTNAEWCNGQSLDNVWVLGEEWPCGLITEGLFVENVTDNAKRENSQGKTVAAEPGVAESKLCEEFRMVFYYKDMC